MYEIKYAEGVADDLRSLRSAQRTRILDRIEEHLTHQPTEDPPQPPPPEGPVVGRGGISGHVKPRLLA